MASSKIEIVIGALKSSMTIIIMNASKLINGTDTVLSEAVLRNK